MKEIKENNINDIHRDIFEDSDIKTDTITRNNFTEEDITINDQDFVSGEGHHSEESERDKDDPYNAAEESTSEESAIKQKDSPVQKDLSEAAMDNTEDREDSIKENNKETPGNREDQNIEDTKTGKTSEIKINIPEGMIDKLPEDFNINDIGNIDLKEAEAIANEDILFLTEDDLILGLEEFDLIPLKEDTIDKSDDTITAETELSEKTDEKSPKAEVKSGPNLSEKEKSIQKKDPEPEPEPDIRSDTKPDAEESELNNIEASEIEETIEEPKIDEAVSDEFQPQKDKPHEDPESEVEVKTETLPENLRKIAAGKENVLFFDDESLYKEKSEKTKLFEEDELEKITSDIVDIVEGKPKILTEDKIDVSGEDPELAAILTQSDDKYKELWLDFEDDEYKYRDSELDFIENAIIGDDYSDYIKEIDSLYLGKEEDDEKKISKAIELFGLSLNEIDNIEERLFHEEYSHIDLEKEYELIKSDFGKIDLSKIKEKFINYLTPDSRSLSEEDKNSIEEDLSSTNALVFEEDINEIKRLYGKEVHDDAKYENDSEREKHFEEEVEAADRIFKENRFEIIEEAEHKEEDAGIGSPDILHEEKDFEIIEQEAFITEDKSIEDDPSDEEIQDITDNIVILEDNSDVDRFIKEFPEDKQMNLKKLLTYLDGLFEKLPESTIKNFANSEYFDLYVKVLNDMGIS